MCANASIFRMFESFRLVAYGERGDVSIYSSHLLFYNILYCFTIVAFDFRLRPSSYHNIGRGEWPGSPVDGNEGKEAVLNLLPFAGRRRIDAFFLSCTLFRR